ncbi:DUF5134 domain-containing protein [Streptomyces sp. NPDC002588]|uniref:DUF5134 domain-containing protein n=1 Tax=Streptomyces sp. NPDC002588 TaxID=3154419 RepID=UPI00331C8044
MSIVDVVPWMLTALCAAAAVHAVRQGVLTRSSGWRGRVDRFLHTAMALAMATMPWAWGHLLPAVPQTAFFAAGALWFPASAFGRSPASRLADLARRLPHAADMAAMAWMHLGHSIQTKGGALVTGVLTLYLLACALRSLTRDMPALRGASGTVGVSTGTPAPYEHFWHGSMALGAGIMLLMHC